LLLFPEVYINVPNHVISHVVTDAQIFYLAILAELLVEILVKVVKVLLDFPRIHWNILIGAWDRRIRPLVHV
jgi:hypothetical protein